MQHLVFRETQVVFFLREKGKSLKGKGAQVLIPQGLGMWGMLREIKSGGLYVFSETGALLRKRKKKGGVGSLRRVGKSQVSERVKCDYVRWKSSKNYKVLEEIALMNIITFNCHNNHKR